MQVDALGSMLAGDDASRARGIMLLAGVRAPRPLMHLHPMSAQKRRCQQSGINVTQGSAPSADATAQSIGCKDANGGPHAPVQVVEAAPESLRGPADASLLADFFSARLADWCAGGPSTIFVQR